MSAIKLRRAAVAALAAVALVPACGQLPRTADSPAAAAPQAADASVRRTATGRIVIVQWPELTIDGRPMRAAPGARILGRNHLTVTPNMVGAGARVQYELDALGQVRLIRVLEAEPAPAPKPRGR